MRADVYAGIDPRSSHSTRTLDSGLGGPPDERWRPCRRHGDDRHLAIVDPPAEANDAADAAVVAGLLDRLRRSSQVAEVVDRKDYMLASAHESRVG